MTRQAPDLTPRSAFAGILRATVPGEGPCIEDRDGLGLATVHAARGNQADLQRRVAECFGIQLQAGPRRFAAGVTAFAGIGVGAWLATRERGGNAFAAHLREVIGDLAAISDQSDGLATLRVRGAAARPTLARMLPIDLHPRAFQIGDVAVTLAEHIGVTICRLEDGPSSDAVFDISVYRSFAADFVSRILSDGAEMGRPRRVRAADSTATWCAYDDVHESVNSGVILEAIPRRGVPSDTGRLIRYFLRKFR